LRLGLTISGLLLLGLMVSETLLDRWPGIARASQGGALARQSAGILRDLRIAIVHCLLAGYLPAAFLAVIRGGKRTVFALQGALDCSAEECEALARSIRFSPGGLAAAGLIGLGLGFMGPYIVPPVPEAPWNPAAWSAEVAWHRVLNPVISVSGAILIYAIVAVSRRMSRLATELTSIDILNVRPLLPFTQQGLTNALLLMGLVSIYGLMLLTETGFGLIALVVAGTILPIAGLALVLPLRGVHGKIKKAKRAELEWVDAALASRREELKAPQKMGSAGDFADLAAYRDLVRDVQEWPISATAYVRFVLYLLIPLVSWAAAALVERFVDVLVF
jgi:hypothetical protein